MDKVNKSEWFVLGFFYLSALVAIFHTKGFSGDSANFPRAVAVIVIVLTSIVVYRKLVSKSEKKSNDNTSLRKLTASIIASFLYVGLVAALGYFIATPLFLLSLARILGYRKWPVIIGVTGGLLLVVYVGFKIVLGAPVPEFSITF